MVAKVKPLTKAETKMYLQLQQRLYATTEVNCEAPVPTPASIQIGAIAQPAHGVEATLAERGGRYGDFRDHAQIAQDLQDCMRNSTTAGTSGSTLRYHGWNALSAIQKQALTVIADKLARILAGDPDYKDNWHDMQGYSKLVEERL